MKKLGVFSNRYVTRNSWIAYIIVIVVINITNITICFIIYKYLNINNIAVGILLYTGTILSDGCFLSIVGIFIFLLYNILQRFRKINRIVMYINSVVLLIIFSYFYFHSRQFYNIKYDSKELSYPSGCDFSGNEMAMLHSHLSDILNIITETYSIQV